MGAIVEGGREGGRGRRREGGRKREREKSIFEGVGGGKSLGVGGKLGNATGGGDCVESKGVGVLVCIASGGARVQGGGGRREGWSGGRRSRLDGYGSGVIVTFIAVHWVGRE